MWWLGGTLGNFHRTGCVSDVKCLLTLPTPHPLPPHQSVLKHTAKAAVAAAAAVAFSERVFHMINVFIVTSPLVKKSFFYGKKTFFYRAVELRRGGNGGKMSAVSRRRRTAAE